LLQPSLTRKRAEVQILQRPLVIALQVGRVRALLIGPDPAVGQHPVKRRGGREPGAWFLNPGRCAPGSRFKTNLGSGGVPRLAASGLIDRPEWPRVILRRSHSRSEVFDRAKEAHPYYNKLINAFDRHGHNARVDRITKRELNLAANAVADLIAGL